MNNEEIFRHNRSMFKKILIGFFAGLISGLFGAGGGMIVIPALVYILKTDEKIARGTTILCILVMVITSGIFYIKGDFINVNMGIKAAIGGVVGGYAGAKLLKKLNDKYLKIFFAAFLIFMGVKMLC